MTYPAWVGIGLPCPAKIECCSDDDMDMKILRTTVGADPNRLSSFISLRTADSSLREGKVGVILILPSHTISFLPSRTISFRPVLTQTGDGGSFHKKAIPISRRRQIRLMRAKRFDL